jgi:hypothetical protein
MVGRIQGLMVDPDETLDMGKVKTYWRRDSIQQSPSINSVESLTLEKEQKILSYFDLEPYWDTTETNSNP